jgi:hypothetical protein
MARVKEMDVDFTEALDLSDNFRPEFTPDDHRYMAFASLPKLWIHGSQQEGMHRDNPRLVP